MTAWNPTIPDPPNVPANDALAMKANNQVLNAAFQADHTPLQNAVNQGMHKQVTFPKPPASLPFIPSFVGANESWLYERLDTANTRSFLEYQPAGGEVTGNPSFTSVVPNSLKAFCVFTLLPSTGVATAMPLVNIKRSFNVTAVADPSPNLTQTSTTLFVVTFQEPIPTNFPFIWFMQFGGAQNERYPLISAIATTPTTCTGFSFLLGVPVVAAQYVGFGVM